MHSVSSLLLLLRKELSLSPHDPEMVGNNDTKRLYFSLSAKSLELEAPTVCVLYNIKGFGLGSVMQCVST